MTTDCDFYFTGTYGFEGSISVEDGEWTLFATFEGCHWDGTEMNVESLRFDGACDPNGDEVYFVPTREQCSKVVDAIEDVGDEQLNYYDPREFYDYGDLVY